ncbi:MAG: hypothetical protein ACRD6W_00770 [Nitrososphaerales archaeon]
MSETCREFDREHEPDIIGVDRTRRLVDGSASLDDLREELHLDLPEGEYVTLRATCPTPSATSRRR